MASYAVNAKNNGGYGGDTYSSPVMGMSAGDIATGNNYDLRTAREKIPFVNNWLAGSLTTLSYLFANRIPAETYGLYKQQEREIVDTALTNADMIKAKGEVELRNLQYKHDREMGSDILKVSGGGGNMSGSFLDALMQQRKYQMMDEQTVATNTINQASAVLKEGYRNAANVATQAQVKAQQQKNGVFNAIMAGLDKYFELSFKDKAQASEQDAANKKLEVSKKNQKDRIDKNYGIVQHDAILEEQRQRQSSLFFKLGNYTDASRGVLFDSNTQDSQDGITSIASSIT